MTFFAHLNNQKKIIFNGGILLSVQAGPYYYSKPREQLAFNTYTHYEIAIIGGNLGGIDFLEAYKESEEDGLTLYMEVPLHLVEGAFLYLHEVYGIKKERVNAYIPKKMPPKQPVIASMTKKIKQKALLLAMHHTQNEDIYTHLGNKLQETIDFIED